ncbi:MAG TPA: hypothetical protein VG755_20830 [Nannocystaceae bacterium]|nr:hypothetical protein [Nannocystaceae bacterium]
MHTRFAVLLVLAACDPAKKDCEHARDVMAGEWDRRAKEAIATVPASDRGKLEQQAAKESEQLRKSFVEVCVAQPEATRACVAKIDELLKQEQARKPGDAKAAGECEAPMAALMEALQAKL